MKLKSIIAIGIWILIHSPIFSQQYIGAGNDQGMTVTASHQYQDPNWPKAALASNTMNGLGMDAKRSEAARFLTQASMGYENYHIDDVANMGIDAWIDIQMQLSQTFIEPKVAEIYQITLDSMAAQGEVPDESEFRPRWWEFNYGYWDQMMRNEDLLRHRVAFALSEIFVISRKSELQSFGDGLANYYDMLASHAFGNYENLLRDVTLHACMGEYLSHLNNPKAVGNIHPDENYAREIMQLFSIGLYELNQDGSRIEINGEFVPTYDQDDIREFAKIFTGLGVGGWVTNPYGSNSIYFGKGIWTADVTVPMIMYENQHEPGPKQLLKGKTVPSGQPGLQDIDDAIHNLHMHPNVGPFMAFRLIQRLVKSNPSPAYVERIAEVFNNNGNGVRGDLGAVVKAILMDGEARACTPLGDEVNSRLKEPLIRYMQFTRAVDKYNPYDYLWNVNWNFAYLAHQDIFNSNSVFNFYLPDHQPNGEIANQDLFAPEYNLHTTLTAPGYINEVYRWTINWGELMRTWEGDWMNENEVQFDLNSLMQLAKDPETFVNELDRLLVHGTMSNSTRSIVRTAMDSLYPGQWYNQLEERVRLGVYLVLISPDYAVMR